MFFAGLAYTGFIAALAVKNCKICKAYLLQNGFREQELEGVTTYMVLRYAELLVRDNKTSEAKAYMKRIREESGFFITSYEKGEKTYVPPWETDRVPATARSNAVAFKRKPARPPRRRPPPPRGKRSGSKTNRKRRNLSRRQPPVCYDYCLNPPVRGAWLIPYYLEYRITVVLNSLTSSSRSCQHPGGHESCWPPTTWMCRW